MFTTDVKESFRAPRYSVSRSVTDRTIEKLLSGLDCPRSLAVALCYKYGEHQQLLDFGFNPDAYASPAQARDAYIATELLSKAEFLKLDVDPEQVAMDAFWETEEHCARINRRFKNLNADPEYTGRRARLLDEVKRKISRLLCENPEYQDNHVSSFDAEEWIDSCAWGPGTSTRISGKATNSTNKFQATPGITRDCYALVSPLFQAAFPLWDQFIRTRFPTWGVNRVDTWLGGEGDANWATRKGFASNIYFDIGNEVLTVLKNAKTKRVISKEPPVNCFLQLGVGDMMRRRLLRASGFDLTDQSRNQRLSFQASLTREDATVDHKDASGCISTGFVEFGFPKRWFIIMDSLRSKYGSVKSKGKSTTFRYEKFSTMGNGFTFPLQSVIFAAIAFVACEEVGAPVDNVGVYGDDLVIPVAALETYCDLASFCGLRINQKKSYSNGVFRESCGAHYYTGADLKPLYIRKRLYGLPSIFKTANGVRRLAARGGYHSCDSRLLPAWRYLRDRVSEKHRYSVPEGFGDGGFVENFDEATPSTIRRWAQFQDGPFFKRRQGAISTIAAFQGIEGFYGYALREVPVKYSTDVYGLMLARVFDLYLQLGDMTDDEIRILSGSGNEVGLRRTTQSRVERALYPKWDSLGP